MAIKILYFITDLGIGGAERILFSMLNKMDKARYLPVVCCLYGGELVDKIKELNIRVVDLKARTKLDVSVFFKLYYLLKKEKPDIVHTHLFHANLIGRLVAKLAGTKIIVSTQHYSASYYGRIGILSDRFTAFLTDQIIAVSEAAKRFCVEEEGIPKRKIKVIYNGIDLDVIDGEKSGHELRRRLSLGQGPIIGCLGRFVEVKGYKYLFYAASDIVKHYPAAKFIILGHGPLKHELMELVNKLGLSNQVIFIDSDTEANAFLSILDIYVLPSLSEGLSVALLEAMAMSKPVVVTKVGGNPEVVIDSENGLLVPPRDPSSLSKAIISILKDDNFRFKIASNARRRIEEKFNIDTMVKDTELVYSSLYQP